MFRNHTHTHTHHKIFALLQDQQFNNYEYNKHNPLTISGYRFTAQHCTIVNVNKQQKIYSTIQTTEFQKYAYKQIM